MQCLSVKQPAAGLLARGDKTIENRSRALVRPDKWQPFWVLVHASQQRIQGPVTKNAVRQAAIDAEPKENYPTGVIIGAMRISAIVPLEDVDANNMWATGPICHLIDKSLSLPVPIPYKGRLGLYDVDPVDLGYKNLEAIAAAFPGTDDPFGNFIRTLRH
jgi:hypothetical protein